jgi:hypothetical protein
MIGEFQDFSTKKGKIMKQITKNLKFQNHFISFLQD